MGESAEAKEKEGLKEKKDDAALSSQPGFLRGCKLCSSYRPLRGSFHSIRYRPASVYLCYELLRESFRFYVDQRPTRWARWRNGLPVFQAILKLATR